MNAAYSPPSGRPNPPDDTQKSGIAQTFRKRLRQVSIKDTRRDRINFYAKRSGLARQTLRESNHRRLGSGVMDGRWQSTHRTN